MSGVYTIGQLAKDAGVPVSTLRFYERKGLLTPSGRTDANYRYYGPSSMERVRFIRNAQQAGFTLKDIRRLLDIEDSMTEPCDSVRELVEDRINRLDRQLDELTRFREALQTLVTDCRRSRARDECRVLTALQNT